MQRFFSFVFGILSGAVVGAVVALLLAPMSGESLRQEAQGRFDNVVDDIRKTYEEERSRLETELEALKRGEIKIA